MPRLVKRVCPACKENKKFRADCQTCGCQGSANTPKQRDTITETDRTIVIPKTRIHTLEQLKKAFEIDEDVWVVQKFECNKWDMGFIQKSTKLAAEKDGTVVTVNDAGHKELYQVRAYLVRRVSDEENRKFIQDNAKLMKENRRLKIQLDAEKRYRQHLTFSTAGMDEALNQIREAAHHLGQVKLSTELIRAQVPIHPAPISQNHSEDAVLLLSDTHCGDVIRRGDTSGFPEFDLPICGNRFGYVIDKVKRILALHRAMYPIKRLYVWVGGDMGNGDLHDAPISNALFIGPQVDFTFKLIKFGIEDLLTLTIPDKKGCRVVEEIVLLFTVGNHMRESTSKFMPLKYQAQRTFDWLIYQMLMTWFEKKPGVTIRRELSPYIFENIRGHRHLFAHGMQVGYRNSPDVQSKTMDGFLKTVRSLFDSPEFRRKNGLEGATFARACIGDIHVPVKFPRLISNGSLNGQNELGVNWGLEPIPAGQQLFGVTESHLETFSYFVECSAVQKDAHDWNPYGHFAAEYEREFGRK